MLQIGCESYTVGRPGGGTCYLHFCWIKSDEISYDKADYTNTQY